MLVCGTGYTGEDGVELLLDPATRRRVWDALLGRASTPAGLGRARHAAARGLLPPVRQRSQRGRGPIEAGLGLVLQGGDRLHRLRERRARASRGSGARSSSPFAIEGAGIARQGNPIEGGGVVTSGTFSPCLQRGIGMAYVPARRAQPGTRARDRRARQGPRRGRRSRKPIYKKGAVSTWPTRAIRTICSTTPSTTGRVIDGDEATFGITWYAQDALGEVVFFDPPDGRQPR